MAVVDKRGRVLDDHGSPLIFRSEAAARRYLTPHIVADLKRRHGRAWLAPYEETRESILQTAYASGRGVEIQ